MMTLFSNEFWIALLFIFQFFLVVFIFILIKKINRFEPVAEEAGGSPVSDDGFSQASGSASQVIDLLEPLMFDARKTAEQFDGQIREKKRLLKELNEALDNRIININLLLSRAQAQQEKLEKQPPPAAPVMPRISPMPAAAGGGASMLDQQHQIIRMYDGGIDPDTIAQQLSIPKGEVELVIDLKKKFLEMEQSGS